MNVLALRTASVSLTREIPVVLRLATKSITSFLLDGLALPGHLIPLGNLIMAFTTSTAATTALHHFLHRNCEHRARIHLPICLVVRMVESNPQYFNLLGRPENLLHLLDGQVMPVLDAHLSEGEAKVGIAQLKRKVCDNVKESCQRSPKRRGSSTPESSIVTGSEVLSGTAPTQITPSTFEPTSSVVAAETGLAVSEADIQAQLLAEAYEDDDSLTESVKKLPKEQHAPCVQRSTELQVANSSQGSSTPQPTPFLFLEPLPTIKPSQGHTSLAPSTVTQTSAPRFAKSPPPSLTNFRKPSSISHYRELELGVPSPNLAPHNEVFLPSGYGLDYNDRTLYSTPSLESSAEALASNT